MPDQKKKQEQKQEHQGKPPTRESIEAEIPQAPAHEPLNEPEPIGGRRGPRPPVEERKD